LSNYNTSFPAWTLVIHVGGRYARSDLRGYVIMFEETVLVLI